MDPAALFATRYGNGLADALHSAMRRVRVPAWEASDHAPGTVADLLRSYRETGRIVVWSGASERTLWGDPSLNHAFRAWHDWCHVRSGLGFDAASEVKLGEWQCGDAGIDGPLASIVLAEISDQAAFYLKTGHFLDGDQVGFALDAVSHRETRRRVYALRSYTGRAR